MQGLRAGGWSMKTQANNIDAPPKVYMSHLSSSRATTSYCKARDDVFFYIINPFIYRNH